MWVLNPYTEHETTLMFYTTNFVIKHKTASLNLVEELNHISTAM